MKVMRLNVQRTHGLIRDLDFEWILPFVQLGLNLQPGFGHGRSDQFDNDFMADQRAPSPIHADVRKQSMLDLVPFARPWGEMTDRDGEVGGIHERLEFNLPESNPIPIAATTVGTNQELVGVRVDRRAHGVPPASNTAHGETRRVVVDTDIDPSLILGHVIDAVWGDGHRDNLSGTTRDMSLPTSRKNGTEVCGVSRGRTRPVSGRSLLRLPEPQAR